MCTGCGSRSVAGGLRDTLRMICRGVTSKWSHVLVEPVHVAAALALPDFDAAGIHQLRGIPLRRAEQPADERLAASPARSAESHCMT